jgi:DNA repair protein RadC
MDYTVYDVVLTKKEGYETPRANKHESAAEIVSGLIGNKDREHFIALILNQRLRVTGVHTVSIGSLSHTVISSREVFKVPILANAHSIILAHNHPSANDTNPSPEDIQITNMLREAGKYLDIPIVDHIIVSDSGGPHFSFAENKWCEMPVRTVKSISVPIRTLKRIR